MQWVFESLHSFFKDDSWWVIFLSTLIALDVLDYIFLTLSPYTYTFNQVIYFGFGSPFVVPIFYGSFITIPIMIFINLVLISNFIYYLQRPISNFFDSKCLFGVLQYCGKKFNIIDFENVIKAYVNDGCTGLLDNYMCDKDVEASAPEDLNYLVEFVKKSLDTRNPNEIRKIYELFCIIENIPFYKDISYLSNNIYRVDKDYSRPDLNEIDVDQFYFDVLQNICHSYTPMYDFITYQDIDLSQTYYIIQNHFDGKATGEIHYVTSDTLNKLKGINPITNRPFKSGEYKLGPRIRINTNVQQIIIKTFDYLCNTSEQKNKHEPKKTHDSNLSYWDKFTNWYPLRK